MLHSTLLLQWDLYYPQRVLRGLKTSLETREAQEDERRVYGELQTLWPEVLPR